MQIKITKADIDYSGKWIYDKLEELEKRIERLENANKNN